jgi:hypothetical protein
VSVRESVSARISVSVNASVNVSASANVNARVSVSVSARVACLQTADPHAPILTLLTTKQLKKKTRMK